MTIVSIIITIFTLYSAWSPDKQNIQPYVVLIHDLDEEESDVCGQYFIAIEQTLMLENSNIFAAIFYVIAAHYSFNVQYHCLYFFFFKR